MPTYRFALVELTQSASAPHDQLHSTWQFFGPRRLLPSFFRDEATAATSREVVEAPQLWPALRFSNSASCLEGLQALSLLPADGDPAYLLDKLSSDGESPTVYLFGPELPQGEKRLKVDNTRNNDGNEELSNKRFLRDLLENVSRHSSANRLLQEATAACLKAFLGEEFSKDRLFFWKVNAQLPGSSSVEEMPWPCLLYHDADVLMEILHRQKLLTEKDQLELAMDMLRATSKQPPQFREGFPLVYLFGSAHAAIQPLDASKIISREEAGDRPTWLSLENKTYQQWCHRAYQTVAQSHGAHYHNNNIPQIAGPVDNNHTAAVHEMDEDFHDAYAEAAQEVDDVAINEEEGPALQAAAPAREPPSQEAQGIAMAGEADVETTQWEPRATRKRTAAAAAAPAADLRVDFGQIECQRCALALQPGFSPNHGPTHHATCIKSKDYQPPSEDILKTLSKEDFDNLPEVTKRKFERDGLNQFLSFVEKRVPACLYRTMLVPQAEDAAAEVPTPDETPDETPSRRIVGLTLPTVCWVTPETREQRDRRKRWEREEREEERRKRRRQERR